jgi:hypothetical protein
MLEDHRYYNCKVTLDNGQEFRISANWIHNNNLDHWQGWACAAGSKRISVDKNFNVYSAQCDNDVLGNIFTNWDIFTGPTTCKKSRCTGCTDDLLTEKRKI